MTQNFSKNDVCVAPPATQTSYDLNLYYCHETCSHTDSTIYDGRCHIRPRNDPTRSLKIFENFHHKYVIIEKKIVPVIVWSSNFAHVLLFSSSVWEKNIIQQLPRDLVLNFQINIQQCHDSTSLTLSDSLSIVQCTLFPDTFQRQLSNKSDSEAIGSVFAELQAFKVGKHSRNFVQIRCFSHPLPLTSHIVCT